MKNLWLTWLILVFGQSGFAEDRISAEMANRLVKSKAAVLIDVRELPELQATGIAAPALWLAKSEIDNRSEVYKKFVAALDQEKSIILYCRSGRRAGQLVAHFKSLGFEAHNMGGLQDWIDAGLPIANFE